MKTRKIIPIIALISIVGVFLVGCKEEESTEPKPDYINVNVSVSGYVFEKDPSISWGIGSCTELCKNFQVQVEVYKDGAIKLEEFQVTNGQCRFQASTIVIKLYKEQPIWIKVKSKNDIPGYIENMGFKELSWNQIYPQYDFGETYNYVPSVDLIVIPE
jgi:hypothetical protein